MPLSLSETCTNISSRAFRLRARLRSHQQEIPNQSQGGIVLHGNVLLRDCGCGNSVLGDHGGGGREDRRKRYLLSLHGVTKAVLVL